MEGDEDDAIPLLRLRSWPEIPSQEMQQLTHAALSPSLQRLLLFQSSSQPAQLLSFRNSSLVSLGKSLTSFAWSCQQDCHTDASGPFQELLVACSDGGLLIYGFANRVSGTSSIDESTFDVNVNLGPDADKLKLVFLEAETWPEVVCFSIPCGSSSFSKMVEFAYGSQQGEAIHHITTIFSSSCNNLVGMLMRQQASDSDEGAGCRQAILIITITESEVRWVARVVLDADENWVDFALVFDKVLGLTLSGRIFIWEALTGSHLSMLDVQRHCGTSDCSSFLRLYPAEGRSLVGVTDKLGQIFLVSLDKHFSDAGLESASSWEVANSDIWIFQSREGRTSPGPSAFTAKRLLASSGAAQMPTKTDNLRKVVLPWVPSSSVGPVAIGYATITRFIRRDGHSILVQSRLHSSADTEDASRNLTGDVLGFSFQGSMYLVSAGSLSVVLPPVIAKGDRSRKETWWLAYSAFPKMFSDISRFNGPVKTLRRWQMAVLDRCLIYDKLEEAEHLAEENGWTVRFVRLRKLQLALDYQRTDEIGQLLSQLVPLDAAESGILRVIFASVALMVNQFGSDNELSQAARLLAAAARFTKELVKLYGNKKDTDGNHPARASASDDLTYLAQLLEVIRSLQDHLVSRRKRPKSDKGDVGNDVVDKLEKKNQFAAIPNSVEDSERALVGVEEEDKRRDSSRESPKEMIARWEKDNVDVLGIVKDALRAGRIPLAVVQLHHRRCGSSKNRQLENDVFKEVQDVGRSIVYELFCKGKVPIALAALRRLGEDIQTVLHDLAFGTVRRSLRAHTTRELRRHGHLDARDIRLLQTISRIEAVYPSSRFWSSYNIRRKGSTAVADSAPEKLQVFCYSKSRQFLVECGEIDGVVLGSWSTPVRNQNAEDEVPKDEPSGAYWAGALVWLQALDQETIDRIILDQGQASDIPWTSQLKYAVVHHSWPTVSSLINDIDPFELQESELEVHTMEVKVPQIKRLTSDLKACSGWLWHLIERELAQKYVFLRVVWTDVAEFLSLLSDAGLIFLSYGTSEQPLQVAMPLDAVQAVHHFVVQHSVHYHLPWLLELYLDEHSLGLDSDIIGIVGDCEWARWLLLSRQKGCEYDASFANARTVLTVHESKTISTLDDLARLGSGLMALSTLMYAPALPQKCIYSRLKMSNGRSWQCALESLRSSLKEFPTLWNTLKQFGKPAFDSALSTYLHWRNSLFSSANKDTSLLLLLPKWLPKEFRKVLHVSIQGDTSADYISPASWEDCIRKKIEREMLANPTETSKSRIERYLLQGCAVAAFQYMVGLRTDCGKPGDFSSLDEAEESLLGAVIPLAIRNFRNTVVTAACALFLELCGVSSTILRTDLSALRRISAFVDSDGTSGENVAMNLAETLSAEYMQSGLAAQAEKQCGPQILQHLETATIESISSNNNSCGLWLKTAEGDGQLLRTSQMSMSERWALVTSFCRAHQLPLSTVYLSYLARDNDWVGFFAEAQAEACPIEILLNVASKDFTDDQLQRHVLIVLKSLSSKQVSIADVFQNSPPGELFALLAEVEHHKTPGGDLLQKAKDLRWPLLAVVASCFNDVSALSCLATWLEITAARETSSIRISEGASHIAACVGSAVDATNTNAQSNNHLPVFVRNGPKRRRLSSSETEEFSETNVSSVDTSPLIQKRAAAQSSDSTHESLARMVAVLCEQQRFIPLLRAFELFLPASPLLHFIRFLRAFSQMRLSEASAHLADFSAFLKEEIHSRGARTVTAWITKAAVAGANAMLAACPSAYEKRCMLQLLAAAEFGDGGAAAMGYRKLYWKIQLAEPSLRQGTHSAVHVADLDDDVLLKNLEQSGQWEDARSWARQLDLAQQSTSSFVHHVTEMQAEAMVTEWKELLWDVPEQRAALWRHCQALFTKHLYPPLKAGMFFLKHAEDIEQNGSPVELHAVLLLALQWLSGSITGSAPVYPVPLLRELETRVWLLAVESEVLMKTSSSSNTSSYRLGALNLESPISMNSCGSPVDRTAAKIAAVDGHLKVFSSMQHIDVIDEFRPALHSPAKQLNLRDGGPKPKRRLVRRSYNGVDKEQNVTQADIMKVNERKVSDEDVAPGWEEKVGEGEVERAILALVEVGQVSAARQLQQKLLPARVPQELVLAETAYSVAMLNTPAVKGSIRGSALGAPVMKTLNSLNLLKDISSASPLQVMEALTAACREGCGRGHCRRVMAVAQVANFLGLPFFEAFQKQPTELLQLLSLKGQDALPEAKLLVNTHSINPASIARILAESFLKGLLAAHRGGYMDSSSKEEGPAPLLWRSSDFVQWAQLCPSEPELGHALMRLVISGHDMPHACEVELLILAHQFYDSSACLDGMDVLVALAATRVESYVAEGDFAALARLVTGVSNFQALRFVLDLLIENGQLELLLKKRDTVDATKESSASVRGFRMAVLSALKHFNPHDLDAFGRVYSHFSMAHEMANLLESRGRKGLNHWFIRNDPDQNEELLDIMKFFADASEVYAGIDCGNKTRWCCAQASLLSLQLRMPELVWLNLTETNARRLLVDQRRFQEALVVAEAYGLNQPAEWVPVLWNQVLSPGWIEHFLTEFVASLPLRPSMLMELARIYRSEVSARGDHLDFSKWLTSGMPPEITKSFRCILRHVADFRLRMQLTTLASGFPDVHDVCARVLDKVPDTAGPLVLKRGHGGTYVPLM